MPNILTDEDFLKDVATHEMKIALDNGVFRCVRFRRPDTSNYHFDITTWPGHLAISGDMGCYVFSRLQDMFEFFRGRLDFHYKAGKVVAEDKNSPVFEFSQDKFRKVMLEEFTEFCARRDLSEEDREPWAEVLEDEVLRQLEEDDSGLLAMRAARDFEIDGREVFPDLFDHNFEEMTWRYQWCCRAIHWAVTKYDEVKASIPVENGEKT
jgi:hypothetical protein